MGGVEVPETTLARAGLGSNGDDVRVTVGVVTVRRSVLEAKLSGIRGLAVNCGHSDGLSLRVANEL